MSGFRVSVGLLAIGLGVALGGCTCTPVNHGGDDDAAAAADAAIDAVREIDARETPAIPPDCLAAAERGLTWLVAQQQNPVGAWGNSYPTPVTAFAVLKLETYAAELGLSPFDPAFVYHSEVARGLRYLFVQARREPITAQPAGNPDSNGNGQGISFTFSSSTLWTYENSVVLMAIVAGADPDRVVNDQQSLANGLTYRAVVEDLVDDLAMAQSDAPASLPTACARGGWSYTPLDHEGGAVGDNSVTQFVTLALEYARHPLYHYEIATPAWVTTELSKWVSCIQNHDGGADDGGSGYAQPRQMVDAYKTGALVQQAAFLGHLVTAPDVVGALAYLHRVWADPVAGWKTAPVSDYLAMYSVMKGMESMAITDLGGIDWYREFCDQLKAEQRPDGSWPTAVWDNENPFAGRVLSTEWALLVLERAAPPPEIIP